jgi:hypothetical protein
MAEMDDVLAELRHRIMGPVESGSVQEGGPGVKYLIPRACAVTDKIMVEEVFTLIERRTLRTGEGVTTCGVK